MGSITWQSCQIMGKWTVAVLKMNHDLERMADMAVNIAGRAVSLAHSPPVALPPSLAAMMHKVPTMVKQSLEALVHGDTALARQVCVADREVDALNRDMHVRVPQAMRQQPDQVARLLHTLSVSRHLERLGDLATNVAEDVIYTVEGAIVRHRTAAYEGERQYPYQNLR